IAADGRSRRGAEAHGPAQQQPIDEEARHKRHDTASRGSPRAVECQATWHRGSSVAAIGSGCAILGRPLRGAVRLSEPATVVLDASGLNCPMPLLKAKKALNEMTAGALLRVIATDPGSVRDFEVFSRQSGHLLLESKQTDGRFEYLLRK